MSGVGRVLATLQSWRPVPTLRADTCTRRYGSECRDCVTACPVQAVTLSPFRDTPLVDAVTCIGCGLCAAACPVDVFEGVGAVPERLVEAARAAGDRLSLRCSKAAAAAQDVTYVQDLFCLGSLHPETVAAAAAARRPGGRLELVSGACATCPVNASRQVESTMGAAQALARRVAPETAVERRTCDPEAPEAPEAQDFDAAPQGPRRPWWRRGRARRSGKDPVAVSRRDLFARLSGQSSDAPGPVGADASAPGAASPAPTRPRAVLLAAGVDVPLPRPHVADGCTACRGCSGACPTRALHWDEAEGAARLDVDPRSCIACGECVRVCPESVVGLVCDLAPGDQGALLPLITVRGSHCERCGGLLAPGEEGRCVRCASRQSLIDDVWAQYPPAERDPG